MNRPRLYSLVTALLMLLLLVACSQPTTPESSPPQLDDPSLATAEECGVFDDNPFVVVRVDFENTDDGIDVAITHEPLRMNYEENYMLLALSLEEFKYLRSIAAERSLTVTIDEERTLEQTRFLALADHGLLEPQKIPGFSCYRTVEETYATMRRLARDYPTLAAVQDIGDSWRKTQGQSGYDILVLKLTNKNTGGTKPTMVVTSAVHAREYPTAELMTRFAEYLLRNYATNATIKMLLDKQELHLILQANPDGRKEAEGGILWRKNANRKFCPQDLPGVDLNRNFPFLWGGVGASPQPCNDTFRGPSAASEPETKAVVNYVRSVFPDRRPDNQNIAAPADTSGIYIDVHNVAALVMWPWGHKDQTAPNGPALEKLGRNLAARNGYTPRQLVGLYPTSGTTADTFYGQLGVASFAFELGGDDFFQDCAYFRDTIVPANFKALLYAFKVARAPYQLPSGSEVTDVSAAVVNGQILINAAAESRLDSSIVATEYYLDVAPWEAGAKATTMNAANSYLVSSGNVKGFTSSTSTTGLSKGQHVLYIRAKNQAGYWGPVSAAFVTIP
jgi:carboxypeptidase T